MVLINEDFPTLGLQINATSARSCNSKIISFSCHGSHIRKKSGY